MDKTIRRGEIYWINPSAYRDIVGSVQAPDRPAIIVSNDIGNSRGPVLEVVYMTTAPKNDLPTHVTIRSAPQVSTALCEQITTISEEQVSHYIGKCTSKEMTAIEQAMLISLGIDIIDLDQKKEPVSAPEPKKDEPPSDLIIKLATAQKESEIYQKLYTELLQKSLDK